MAKYRARICPNCRYFLAFSVSKSSANDKEIGVISFCLNCSYRLPIHTILYGIRRAASNLRRARLKLARNFKLDRNRNLNPNDESINQGAASGIRIVPPENHSRHLRVIGQQLQQERIANFNLQCTEDKYSVWTCADTPTWPNQSFCDFGRRRLEKWWDNARATRGPRAHARFEYSIEDLADMEFRARMYRDPMGGFANGHSLSQLLRTIGSLTYQRNQRLLAISWRDSSICVVVETAQPKREIETFRADNLYDIWVRMYLRRENRALPDVPH